MKYDFSIRKRQLEFISGFYCFVLGLWLLNPQWDTFYNTLIFGVLKTLATETMWGVAFLAVGLYQLTSIFFLKLIFRQWACIITMFAFIVLSMSAFLSNITSTATPSFLSMALCAWLAYIEVASDKKRAGNHGI